MYHIVEVFTSSSSSELAYDYIQCRPDILLLAGERLLTSVHKNSDSTVRRNFEIFNCNRNADIRFRIGGCEVFRLLGYNEM
jgi:hypothetical protein